MNKLFYLLISILLLFTITLFNSTFFGNNSYSKKQLLINENNNLVIQNNHLKNKNDILEFEINNAQKSDDHVENFAREKLNLSYPNEEFISFKEEDKDNE
ncbi:MAG: septum formation initiator family protein [SAR86 cluster bacterium]|uniref:Septum formation initiator family protein n=1 Tax=SAR86 cluster bacterium TaxID=2030880 RepID=A0A520MJ52_9GAMM|nr:MAG: septum formation initiator family protein [SAR86 cluster bacterium]